MESIKPPLLGNCACGGRSFPSTNRPLSPAVCLQQIAGVVSGARGVYKGHGGVYKGRVEYAQTKDTQQHGVPLLWQQYQTHACTLCSREEGLILLIIHAPVKEEQMLTAF